ncbi:Minor extracellular protease vpr [Thalassocella blandensis]|nr:Minor extracellular protease vpr [Thalassocella blandensis]
MKSYLLPLLGAAAFVTAASTAYAVGPVDDRLYAKEESIQNIKRKKQVYIVTAIGDSVLGYDGGVEGFTSTKPKKGEKINVQSAAVKQYGEHLEKIHNEILSSVGASSAEKIYSYRYAANGFAATLTEQQAEQLKSHSRVLHVSKDEILQPQTDNTPHYLGLTERGQAWSFGVVGEDVVVGVIDTGIEPEHPSVADVRTPRFGNRGLKLPYGKPPANWYGTGCDFGNGEHNPLDARFACNDKLLKAQYFVDGWGADNILDSEFLSARDSDGHGTHTATTAAGNYGVDAYVNGEFQGVVSGVAPRARIAVYKVCWEGPEDGGCASSDSMAAIDQAVADGVDVINFSIGGSSTSFNGPDDLAFLRAADAGVWVATSQGNSGPNPATVGTPAGVPWITAVGASQDDQVFATGVVISSPADIADQYLALEGSGIVSLDSTGDITSEFAAAEPLNGCGGLTNADAIEGKIALVIRGTCGFLEKYVSAATAGAKAIVVYNDGTADDRIYPIYMGGLDGTESIPGVMTDYFSGDAIFQALAAGESVVGKVGPSIKISQDNRIAEFSSRGPNAGAMDIIKPDVVAPGVQILAGGTTMPNASTTSGQFVRLNGTSMASPHVAGLFALLKQVHPDWTPAMARSALMTTARSNLKKTFGEEAADPFDIGAGHVVPSKMFSPGLVYDAGLLDYLAFSCGNNVALVEPSTCEVLAEAGYSSDGSDLNLPSIAIGELIGTQVVTRTVTSVALGNRRFRAHIDAPEGLDVWVSPSSFRLRKGESATFQVGFRVKPGVKMDEWSFGSIEWKYGFNKSVRSPIAVRPVSLRSPDAVSGTGESGAVSFNTVFGFDGDFSVAVDGLAQGLSLTNVIEDGGSNQDVFVIPEGVSLARFAMYDEEVGDGSMVEDLDIQVYGPDTAGFPAVGSSGSSTSAESVDLVNPEPGVYVVVVNDYATTEGPTPYALYNYNLTGSDAGNLTVNAPTTAGAGSTGTVDLEWTGLAPESRYLGILNYTGAGETLSPTTEVNISTH